ncbi:hypothetical protein [Ruegeria arenilitoris]|uniref:hypothetical protein n=1 Tax=Ruegeria arenilitoris TaxID=1173585 RepID=UPI001480D92C|nr:hypothetical protein [Ruegeria arenilitoris]
MALMQQETVVPPISKIAELENWLAMKPGDLKSIRQLVTRLEHAPKAPGSAGRFSAAQADIVTSLGADWRADLFEPEHMVEQYRAWLAALRNRGVSQEVPIGQVFSGRVLKVRGQNAYCGVFLDFFKETGAIPVLCNDCYKVQILPHDLLSKRPISGRSSFRHKPGTATPVSMSACAMSSPSAHGSNTPS